MDRNEMIYGRIYKAFLTYMDRETKKEKTRFLAGFPYEADPHNKHYDIPTAINLGTEFVLQTMNGNGPVPQAIEAVKMYLKTIHFENPRDLDENTESFLFKTMFCAPARYTKTILDAGLKINALRCHPIYTDIKDTETYPMLAFAAEVGDVEKVEALLKAGADKSFGARAAVLCVSSTMATAKEKIRCLGLLEDHGVNIFKNDIYEQLITQDLEVNIWLVKNKEFLRDTKKISHHQYGNEQERVENALAYGREV